MIINRTVAAGVGFALIRGTGVGASGLTPSIVPTPPHSGLLYEAHH